MNIDEIKIMFDTIYGKGNPIYIHSLNERINFLNIAIGELQDGVRKGRDKAMIGRMLARIVSWTFCVSEHFKDLPLNVAMCKKWGGEVCNYCHHQKCICKENRTTHIDAKVTEKQLKWSLTDWSKHFAKSYLEKNTASGFENMLNRLVKEVMEIQELQMGLDLVEGELVDVEMAYAKEISDTLAWTISIANILDIDLEKSLVELYGKGCPACKKPQCVCGMYVKENGRMKRLISTAAILKADDNIEKAMLS